MSSVTKKVLGNASWLASEKVVTMAVNLLIALVLARSLDPEGYGSLNYLLAIIGLIAPLSSLGLNVVVTREIVNQPEQNDTIIATAVTLRVAGSFIGTVGCLALAATGLGLSTAVERWCLSLLGLASFFTAFHVLEYWFQAHVNARSIARMRGGIISLFGAIKVVAAFASADLLIITALFALESVAISGGFLLLYRRKQGGINWCSFNLSYGRSLLRQGFWLVFSGFAAVVYLKIDQIMLAQLVGREAVGVYAVAARLSEAWYFFATALVVSLFPALLKLRSDEPDRYQLRLQQICDVLFSAAFILAIAVSLAAGPLIVLLFGPDYQLAAPILTVHIWASIFIYMRALVSKWLIAEHLLVFSFVSHGLGAVANILLNWWLIPLYGGLGAAYATVLSYFIASYLAFWWSGGTRPIASIMTRSLLLPLTCGYRYWSKFSGSML